MKIPRRKRKNLIDFRFIFIFGLLLCFPVLAAAQTNIRGSVIDVSGEPVGFASVAVKGTTAGAVTDVAGLYNLTVPKGSKTLVFSFLGYQTQEVPFNPKQQVYNVVLREDENLIDEVVVIGYGSILKKDLTGSVSSLSGKTLQSIPITNTEAALTGRMAGVKVTTSDGAPDAEVQIRVRGGGSITQDNSPLFIVDGFPMDNISNIASTDIESIDVLKDASSTAIYGARGANGVVIITTKSAVAGKTVVSYNGYAQMKKIIKNYDVLDSYEFVKLQHELNYIKYYGEMDSFTKMFGDYDDFDIYRNIKGKDSQKEMYGDEVWGQSHNVNISGGTDITKFTASLTYLNEDGILRNSSFDRLNLNLKLNHQISKTLKLDLSAYYSNASTLGAGTSANSATEIKNAVSFRPVLGKSSISGANIDVDPGLYDDIESQSELYDPVQLIDQDYKKRVQKSINVNAALSWTINKFLSYKGEYGAMSNERTTYRFYGPITTVGRTNGRLPVAQITEEERPRWRTAHTLNYRLKNYMKKHDVNILGGMEAISESQKHLFSQSRMFSEDMTPDDAFIRMQDGSPEYTTGGDEPDDRLLSFFGRVNYTYANKYLFSATLRADGSSKFAKGNQWGMFPSAAFAWRVSEESFMKNIEVLDDLKVRLSYGEAGNNRIPNDMYRPMYMSTTASPVVGINNEPNRYYTLASKIMPNPDLKWERTVTRNLGLDFSIFRNRLNGTIDTYWNTTKDLLLQSVVPEHTGYTYQQKNIGQTSNRGVELTLNARIVQAKDFTLTAGFNIGVNRNKVDKLIDNNSIFYRSGWADGLRDSDDFLLTEGQSVGLMYGYVTDGFYGVDDYNIGDDGKWSLKPGVPNSQGIVDSHWTANMAPGMPNPGTLKLKKTTPYDPNDPESCIVTKDDRKIIGNANPKHTGGFNFVATYKNIDVSAYFNWVYGNDVYNANKILFSTQWKKNYYNMTTDVDSHHRFRHINDMGVLVTDPDELRELNVNASIWNPAMKVPVLHSWAIEDGSFLRLSNVIVGYTLPQKWTKKILVSRCRIYGTVNNVFIWTKYSGLDPEVNTRTATPLTPGVDYSSYPKARVFTLGANLTF